MDMTGSLLSCGPRILTRPSEAQAAESDLQWDQFEADGVDQPPVGDLKFGHD